MKVHLKIDRAVSIPLHEQVRAGILSQIRGGDIQVEEKLFTEGGLAKANEISLAPIRQAIDSLVAEGILERRRAKGVYLASKKNLPRCRITFVVPDVSYSFYGSMVRGVENCAKVHHYDITIAGSEMCEEEEYAVLTQLEAADPHPILICSMGGEKNILQVKKLIAKGFPVIAVDQHAQGWAAASVGNDNVQIGVDATKYLLKRGHRRIAFLAEDDRTLTNSYDRQYGYERAMQQAGLPSQIHCIYYPHKNEPWDKVVQPRVVEWLGEMSSEKRPTALFVVNDVLAVSALWALDELGISVPKEMSVIGCADLDFAQMLTRPLTTVNQDGYGMGRAAVELAIQQVGHSDTGIIHQTHPHRIVSRATVRDLRRATGEQKKLLRVQ